MLIIKEKEPKKICCKLKIYLTMKEGKVSVLNKQLPNFKKNTKG